MRLYRNHARLGLCLAPRQHMNLPSQEKVMDRLQYETVRAGREMEERDVKHLNNLWSATKRAIKTAVMVEYQHDFQGQAWDLPTARAKGTLIRIERHVRGLLQGFADASMPYIAEALRQHRHERKLRMAWMLDMVTPPGIKPLLHGRRVHHRESSPGIAAGAAQVLLGDAAKAAWVDRYGMWLGAYQSTLVNNIALGAMNASELSDAADAVDSARPGSPANDFWTILERVMRTEIIGAQARASQEFTQENEDLLTTEVWVAHDDSRVCADCEMNDGKEREDVGGDDVPLHPNCRCFWRMVPKAWQELMGKMSPEDAAELSAQGIAPSMMGVVADDGSIGGFTTVDYYDWKGNLVATY